MKMTVVIYQDSKIEGDTLEEGLTGGVGAANISLSRQLANLGYKMTFLCNCQREGVYAGVEFLNIDKAQDLLEHSPIDFFISEASPKPFQYQINAKKIILRTGLHYNAKPIQFFSDKEIIKRVDYFSFVGSWQAENIKKYFGLTSDNFFILQNGYDPSLLKPSISKIKGRLIYCSTPARGLDVIVDVFPRIKKKFKPAELFIFSDYEIYGFPKGEGARRYPKTFKKMSQPGIHYMGNIKRPQLMEELQRSYILAYPSHFNECSSMATIEAQAAGAVPVTSRLAGLRDTIIDGKTGILLPGNSRSFIYKWRYINAVVDLLNNEKKWAALSEAGEKWMSEEFTWQKIALVWDKFFKKVLRD
jgi:glycosyltransferase involved in cell wall biosynthesis